MVVVPVSTGIFGRSCSTAGRGCKLDRQEENTIADERLFLRSPAMHSGQVLPIDTKDIDESKGRVVRPRRAVAIATMQIRSLRLAIANDWDREVALSAPFHFAPVFLGAGAVIYFTLAFEPSWVYLISSLIMLIGTRLALRRKPLIAMSLNLLILAMLGAIAGKWETVRHDHIVLGGELSTTMTGVVKAAERTERGSRVWLDIVSTREPELKHAPSAIRITMPKSAPIPRPGDTVNARVRLQPPGGPVKPGSYNFEFEAWFDDVGATGFVTGPVTITPAGNTGLNLHQRLELLRANVAERVRDTIGGEEGDVAAALISGVQSGISEETTEAMRISGLAHVLSISGLHMALAAAIFLYGIRGLFALVPNVAARLPVKKIAAVLALLSCSFYLALSGAAVATTRSWIMIAVMLIAILLDRPALTLRNLAISAILILAVTPHEVMGPSFQLSFAATAALISAYGAYAHWQANKSHQVPQSGTAMKIWRFATRTLAASALASLVAGLATALISVWHFHRLAPLGLPANLAAMIPISVIIMPFAVLAMILMPFGLDGLPLKIMGWGVRFMNEIAIWFASISPDISATAFSRLTFLYGLVAMILLILFQTRLRWLSLLPAMGAMALLPLYDGPDLLIGEDAKLVAVKVENGQYAINRKSVGKFVGSVWGNALGVFSFEKPVQAAGQPGNSLFLCDDTVCKLKREDGLRVVWQDYPKFSDEAAALFRSNSAKTDMAGQVKGIEAEMVRDFRQQTSVLCNEANILIVNGPVGRAPCDINDHTSKTPLIIDASTLARLGAAEIRMTPIQRDEPTFQAEQSGRQTQENPTHLASDGKFKKNQWTASIRHAVAEPLRPWNRERVFSRAARNLPPFRPIRQKLEETPDANLLQTLLNTGE